MSGLGFEWNAVASVVVQRCGRGVDSHLCEEEHAVQAIANPRRNACNVRSHLSARQVVSVRSTLEPRDLKE